MTIHTLDDLEISIGLLDRLPNNGDTNFLAFVSILVGRRGERSTDSFEVVVASPNRLSEHYAVQHWTSDGVPWVVGEEDLLPGGKVLPVQGLWLMAEWSLAEFTEKVERLFRSFLPAPDFGALAYRVNQIIPWEFAYKYEAEQNRLAGLPGARISFWTDEWEPSD